MLWSQPAPRWRGTHHSTGVGPQSVSPLHRAQTGVFDARLPPLDLRAGGRAVRERLGCAWTHRPTLLERASLTITLSRAGDAESEHAACTEHGARCAACGRAVSPIVFHMYPPLLNLLSIDDSVRLGASPARA